MKQREALLAADLQRQRMRAQFLCDKSAQLVARAHRTAHERIAAKLDLAATLLWVAQGRADYYGWMRCKQIAQSVYASATQFLSREAWHPGDQEPLWAKLARCEAP